MKKFYTYLLFLLGFSLAAKAQFSEPTHVWEFDEPVVNKKVEGWEVINYDNPNTVDGILQMTTTNTGYPDLEYVIPNDVTIDPSVTKQIVIGLKNGTSSRRARFYWVKDGVNIRFDFLITIEDEEFKEYVIDLSHDSRWSGDIESIRFEIPMPVPAASVGTIVSVDYIKLLTAPPPPAPMPSMIPPPFGVNLASAGFAGNDYEYPQSAELDYFKSKNLNLVRVAFKWERIQPALNGPLAERDLNELKNLVWAARTRGMWVLFDIHNYGRRPVNGVNSVIGENGLTIAHFADVWKKLAEEFKDFGNIYAYGLMNEPYGMKANTPWVNIAQGAIDAIRTVDTHTAIMVGGESYSSSARWPAVSDNLRNLIDPSDNLIFEAHVYFDNDASGTYDENYDEEKTTENTGIARLEPFVEWLEKYNLRGFIGEYGVPDSDPRWNVVLDKTLTYLKEKGINGTYWAAGSRWGDHHMAVHPYNDLTDRPQMAVLENYAYANAPSPQPEITSPYSAVYNIAKPITYKVTATNNPTSITVDGLPEGLTFDAVAQEIAGEMPVGTHTVEISATNEEGTGSIRQVMLKGVHLTIPGVVQAEDYDQGGQGVGYFDNTIGNDNPGISYRHSDVDFSTIFNDGNYHLTNTEAGEWLKYTLDVTEETSYTITLRYKTVASPIINITIDGEEFSGDIALPLSYPWAEMTFEVPVLTAGIHEIKFNIISGGFELDYLDFAINTIPENAPTGLSGERIAGGSINISWDIVEGASKYTVMRAENETGPFESIAEGITDNTFVDEEVADLTTYYYKIVAANLAGEGPESEVIELPGLPLSVGRLDKIEHIEVYPNPSEGQFHIRVASSHSGEITVLVHNPLGILVYKNNDFLQGNYQESLDLRGIPAGIYFVKVIIGNFAESKTLIIQ